MQEIQQFGSDGGETQINVFFLSPISLSPFIPLARQTQTRTKARPV